MNITISHAQELEQEVYHPVDTGYVTAGYKYYLHVIMNTK